MRLTIRLIPAAVAVLCLASLVSFAADKKDKNEPEATFRAGTTLVQLDVVATDDKGQPIKDLKPEDFTLEENGKKQKLLNVTFTDPSQRETANLPPNVYSNRVTAGTCSISNTVLLLDGLNTSSQDQSYARQQLLKFAATQIKPGEQVAVFALGANLNKLQDFTSDPTVLKLAIEKALPQNLAQTAMSTPGPEPRLANPTNQADKISPALAVAVNNARANLAQFQQQVGNFALQDRIGRTLAALRVIGNTLEARPCRKNLVWVSAGYPFTIIPQNTQYSVDTTRMADPTAPPPLPNEGLSISDDIRTRFIDEIRRTTTLLNDARVAIYPVDARGLVNVSNQSASDQGVNGGGQLIAADTYARQVLTSNDNIQSSQDNMADLAKATGGRALVNRNDIANAVAIAANDGQAYYTLSYTPEHKKLDNSFRQFRVKTARNGVKLRYRTGYYAVDPEKDTSPKQRQQLLATEWRNPGFESSRIPFDVRLAPPANGEMSVQFFVNPDAFPSDASGPTRKISASFLVAAITSSGKVEGETGQTIDLNLNADQYAMLKNEGLLFPMKVKLPADAEQLRFAIRDNENGTLGTVTAPVKTQ